MTEILQNRYDFVLLFDVQDGNPNGDPDADNEPRLDPEDNHGLVTDVCLKRKIRNRIELEYPQDGKILRNDGMNIFIKEGAVLNDAQKAGRDKARVKDKTLKNEALIQAAQKEMFADFFDVRTMGAVMSTGKKANEDADCGQVKGPLQLTFARSLHPISTQMHTITRRAVTNVNDAAKERTMGSKHTVPYALYRGYGFLSAAYAEKTGFTVKDKEILFDAIKRMFWEDASASRGLMALRGFYVFKHDCKWGNAAPHELFQRIEIKPDPRNPDGGGSGAQGGGSPLDSGNPPRSFADYAVTVNEAGLPAGVTLESVVADALHRWAE
jgi:CRISPR-associated protein Csd2